MPKRSTAGRPKTPSYDKEDLNSAVLNWVHEVGVKQARNYGAYAKIGVNQAAKGYGFLHNAPLLERLIVVNKFLMFNYVDLIKAFEEAAQKIDGLSPEGVKIKAWAGDQVGVVQVLLNHVSQHC